MLLDEYLLVILDAQHRAAVYDRLIYKDTSTILGCILIIFNDYFFLIMEGNLTQISTAAFAAKFQSKRGK